MTNALQRGGSRMIYFATHRGTSERYAKILHSSLTARGVAFGLSRIDRFNPEVFKQYETVVLIASTHAKGGATPDASEFVQWLGEQKKGSLNGLRFGICGLGASNLPTFAKASKDIYDSLCAASAEPLCERGEADACKEQDEMFTTWMNEQLFPRLLPVVTISYGTFKGTTECFAKLLKSELFKHGIRVKLQRMDSIAPDQLIIRPDSKFALLLIPSHSKGSPTPDASGFFHWMRHQKDRVYEEKQMRFAICGFGTSKHEFTFNKAGEDLEVEMVRCGLEKMKDLYSVDYSNEETFRRWMNEIVNQLQSVLPPDYFFDPNSCTITEDEGSGNESSFSSLTVDGDQFDLPLKLILGHSEADLSSQYCPVEKIQPGGVESELLFTGHTFIATHYQQLCQEPDDFSCVHAEFHAPDGYVTAGDVIINPENPPDLVNWFFNRFPLFLSSSPCSDQSTSPSLLHESSPHAATPSQDTLIHFLPRDPSTDDFKRRFPTPCPIRTVLTSYLDLNHLPPKKCLSFLIPYLTEPKESAALSALLSPSNADFFDRYIRQELQLDFREFLEIFTASLSLPLLAFIQICPLQTPRTYSIATSSIESPNQFGFAASLYRKELPPLGPALEEFKSRGLIPLLWRSPLYAELTKSTSPRLYQGLCSSYLCKGRPTSVRAKLVDSVFTLPQAVDNRHRPIIFIGAGSGIGPLRAVWREVLMMKKMQGVEIGPMVLFFGCKYSQRDWIYREEMKQLTGIAVEGTSKNNGVGQSSESHGVNGYCDAVSINNEVDRLFDHYGWAFSRDHLHNTNGNSYPHCSGKYYIDVPIKESADVVWDLMNRNGMIYMCGSTGFQKTTFNVLNTIGQLKMGNAKVNIVDQWIKEGRLIEEVFG